MNWQEVCGKPSFKDLPFKIELDEHGRIIMSPATIYHSALQIRIAIILEQILENGVVLSDCAIKTRKGTKVTDVAWVSERTWRRIRNDAEATVAPEICIEIIIASNTPKEISEKIQLYFAAGVKEVWLCVDEGEFSFFNSKQTLMRSELVPEFPVKVNVD